MRILSTRELNNEVGKIGMKIAGRHLESRENVMQKISIDYSRLTAPQGISLSQSLARFTDKEGYQGGLFWVADWGIRNEDTEKLAEFYMQRLRGSTSTLKTAPANLFDKGDQLLTEALVSQTIIFRWGAFFIPKNSNHFIELSNDELVLIFCRNQEVADAALNYFSHWKPALIDSGR